jgi:hypothetical protein
MRHIRNLLAGASMAAGLLLAVGASAQSTSSTGGTTQGRENTSVYGSDSTQRGSSSQSQGSIGSGQSGSSQDMGTGSTSKSDQGAKDQYGANLQGQEVNGTVSKVGQSSLQINTDEGNKLTLKADDQTKFTDKSGQVKSLQDIKEGEQVRASFDPESADNRAIKIEVIQSDNLGGSSGSSGSMGGSSGTGSSGTSGSSGSSGSSSGGGYQQ